MKNIFLSTTVLVLLFSSCKENSKETTGEKISDIKKVSNTSSLIGSWVEPNPINTKEVQGFTLKSDSIAESINMATLVYKKWWEKDGKLILVAESIGNHTSGVDTTSYIIMKSTEKELQLKDRDYIVKYTKR